MLPPRYLKLTDEQIEDGLIGVLQEAMSEEEYADFLTRWDGMDEMVFLFKYRARKDARKFGFN